VLLVRSALRDGHGPEAGVLDVEDRSQRLVRVDVNVVLDLALDSSGEVRSRDEPHGLHLEPRRLLVKRVVRRDRDTQMRLELDRHLDLLARGSA
jgi:hypothetical protein